MKLLWIVLVLLVIFAFVHESEETHGKDKKGGGAGGNTGGGKGDPYKPIIRILKELRKAQKYKYKYGHGGGGGSSSGWRGGDDSDESSEENVYGFGGGWNRPYMPRPPNNYPSHYPSSGSSSASSSSISSSSSSSIGGGGNPGGGGNIGDRVPFIGGGQDQNPVEQFNGGIGSVLESLGSLTLGQLIQGAFH